MTLYNESIRIIKNNQTSSGAYIACPNFSQYGFCWLRDGSFIAESMFNVNEKDSARSFFKWGEAVIKRYSDDLNRTLYKDQISLDDFLPTRYTSDGYKNHDDWENAQSDGYGTYLWGLERFVEETNYRYDNNIVSLIVKYLEKVWNIPCYDVWEEESDAIHTSTLISIAAGLRAAERLLGCHTRWREVKRYIETKLVKNGRLIKSSLNDTVDSSLIWGVVPFRLWEPEDPLIKNTLSEIEQKLLYNGGLKRYGDDTYYGGGSWLLLSSNLADYYKEIGKMQGFQKIKDWIERKGTIHHELPEQIPEYLINDQYYAHWVEKWGTIATPLLWSHANYLKLFD